MSVMCSAVSVALTTVGTDSIGGVLASHIESCETCSREYDAYAVMYEELANLRYSDMQPPYGFQWRVMTSLGPEAVPDADDRWEHVVPIATAAALATAAAAAGTAVFYTIYRNRAA